ncbi:MAG: phosphatidylglycerophosphatase A [Campylobacterota bacterium]|nr:phosphatidylglycerophosphatase A [Campylobacterota bacterium]
MTLQKLFVTFLGTGLSPKYPEIAAILTALIVGVVLLDTMGIETLFMLILAVSIIGTFEINKYDKQYSSEVVIDDAAGMWLALLIPYTTALSLSYPYAQELGIFFSFASFCLFVTWKPSTIGWIEKNVKGGLGIMGSAVLAGFAGGFLTIVILIGIGKLL